MSKSNKELSPCKILFRSKQATELYSLAADATSSSAPLTLLTGSSKQHAFAPDGSKVLIHTSNGVSLVDLTKLKTQEDVASSSSTLPNTANVLFMSFSAKGSYILTWEKPAKAGTEDAPPNLKIWSASTQQFLHGFHIKNVKKSQWPPIKWSHDENIAFHMVTNEIHVYNGHAFSNDEVRFESKIRQKGIEAFSVPESYYSSTTSSNDGNKYVLATFIPEIKGKPARVSMMRYPDKCGDAENPSSGPLLLSKSFYQAEECTLKWSPKGDSALALTHTSVDVSGGSYYGSTNLYLLLSETRNSNTGEAISVPLPVSDGPVLDVAWMPNPTKPSAFAVISGKMPSMGSLHNGTSGEATFLFGNAHRNTIVWSEHGRFITLGGFGNLAGGMDFFDRNKLKPMPQYDPSTGADLGTTGNTASCVVGNGWSPDSRYFMVSTTSPRMNVDNGVRLYKYNGLQLSSNSNLISWDNSKFQPNLLLAAEFVPALKNYYPDRPQSPPPKRTEGGNGAEPTVANKPAVAPPAAAYVPPVGRYVPPSARNRTGGGGMSLAERMRKEREGSTIGATKVTSKGVVGAKSKGPVGSALAASDTKSKNAQRKERQRMAKKKAEEAEKEEAERKAREEQERIAAAANDPEKRAKKLKKLLKQIADLKKKDPSSLNDDQQKKLATEDELTKELASLGL